MTTAHCLRPELHHLFEQVQRITARLATIHQRALDCVEAANKTEDALQFLHLTDQYVAIQEEWREADRQYAAENDRLLEMVGFTSDLLVGTTAGWTSTSLADD